MPGDDRGVFLSFFNMSSIDVYRKSVIILSFSHCSKNIFIIHGKYDISRILQHKHLLFIVFSGKYNICLNMMRKHIAAEKYDFLKRAELFSQQASQKPFKLIMLLHKILHT
jgi:hypothetical protein